MPAFQYGESIADAKTVTSMTSCSGNKGLNSRFKEEEIVTTQ